MTSATLGDFMTLNDQLAALAQAGIDVDLGLGGTRADAATSLGEINAAVARRLSQGASLNEALTSEERVIPPAYRSLVRLGLLSGQVSEVLTAKRQLAASVERSWYSLQASLLYPLIVCFLAYLGTIGLCLIFVPTLENLYNDLQLQPGIGLRAIQAVRDALPWWVALPPLAVLAWAAWHWLARGRQSNSAQVRSVAPSWLPGASRAIRYQRLALFSESLAMLLEREVPLAESLRLAAESSGDLELQGATEAVATSLERGGSLSGVPNAAGHFPPFLRWALWHSEAVTGRPRALRMAADIYHEAADRRLRRLQVTAPMIACVTLAGGVTLLYGLALFVPLIDLLRKLA